MGPSLCFLSAGLQALAAILAFRWIRKRWGWALLAAALALMAIQRLAVGLELLNSGGSMPLSEWFSLVIAILSLFGVVGLRSFFQINRRDAECGLLMETRLRAEQERDHLLETAREVAQDHQQSLQRVAELASFLKTVVDTADVWINTLDLDARIVLWNNAAERISGYGRAEVLNRSDIWERLYPDPAYRADIFGKVTAILQRDDVVRDLETTLRTKDGESRIISWASRTLRNEQGVVTGSIAIGQDVTEIRKTEQAFQQVHVLQNLILEHNVLGIAFVRDRRIEWANPRAAEQLGVPLTEIIGASARILYPDDATYEEAGKKAYARMARGIASDNRFQLRRSNGQYFWCRLVGMAVDATQPHAGSVWLAEDISQQVMAESTLSESEARFRGAFEGTQDALLLLTPDGIFDCNQRALDLFGFAYKSEMVRLHPADLSPAIQPDGGQSRALSHQHLQTALREGSTCFRWEHRHQNGELFPAEVLLSSFVMGRRKVIQASVRDLRDRLMAEERIRESEGRFRRFFERYADAMLLLDTRTNEIVDFNQAALDMLRCSREELVHIQPEDISPEFQPDGRSSLEKGQEMSHLAIQKGSHRFLWAHRSPHREDFQVEVLLTTIEPGPSPLAFSTWREVPPVK